MHARVGMLLCALAVACGRTDDASRSAVERSELPEAGPDPSELRCTKEGYPCSWADADPAAFERSIELGDAAARRINADGPYAVAEELAAVPGVAETGATKTGAYFRVEGGRRVWVLPARSEWRGAGSHRAVHPTLVGTPAASIVATTAQVVGEDRNGDGKINQRDPRRALILDPVADEGAEGADVAAILQASEAYEGNVDYLAGEAADVAAFGTWEEYDIIHVASHGLVSCEEGEDDFCFSWGLVTGETLFVGDLDDEERAAKRSELGSIGVEIAVQQEEEDVVWSLVVTADFFKWTYFNGLEKKIVYMSACSSTTNLDLEDGILGTVWVPGRGSMLIGWDGSVTFEDAHRAAVAFFDILVGEGLSVVRSFYRIKQQGLTYSSTTIPTGFVEDIASRRVELHGRSWTNNLRAREIPALVDRRRAKLKDGDDLARFLKGVPGDGNPDTLTMIAEIEGLVDDNEDTGLVDRTLSSDVLHTQAWLELDGRPLMDPEPLFGKPWVDKSVRVDFDDVPLGFDVEEDREYEIEVVVDLPAESYEDGESRYSVKLETLACNVPSQGDYQGTLGGERARVIEPGSRGAFAKILPSPLGGWALQVRSRERGGKDLTIHVRFDQRPEAGTTVSIEDASWTDSYFPIGGGVDRFDRDRHASWHMGSLQITFDAIRSPEGKRFKWVCGQIEGELSGFLSRPPAGATAPIPVSGTFNGSFRAEWKQR